MSRIIAKYLADIRAQRQILDDWTAYEYDIDKYISDNGNMLLMVMYANAINKQFHQTFDAQLAYYEKNLNRAEKRLKIAKEIGYVVDVSGTALAADICGVRHIPDYALQSKQRARDNLARMDIADKTGKIIDANVSKLTIQRLETPETTDTAEKLMRRFITPTYETVTLVSVEDKEDAMLYKLAI